MHFIAKKYHYKIIQMETDIDHIHILLEYKPKDSISNIVKILKQQSTYYLWLKYNDYLKQYFWKKKIIWSEGYFASSIGKVSQKTIEAYKQNNFEEGIDWKFDADTDRIIAKWCKQNKSKISDLNLLFIDYLHTARNKERIIYFMGKQCNCKEKLNYKSQTYDNRISSSKSAFCL